MVEIAICLAIIGIALVAIIGVLPIGMRMQRDNREQTVINQDATVFLDAIRGGARGMDDLTNYVYAITNYRTIYNADGTVGSSVINGYTYTSSSTTPSFPINSGASIIGLMSTPEFVDLNGQPVSDQGFNSGGFSNHIVAYVHSISGPAVEKPPQANGSVVRDASFTYRILCANAPVALALPWQSGNAYILGSQVTLSNSYWQATANTAAGDRPGSAGDWARNAYFDQLAPNLRELRLTFLWPQLPNGRLGFGRQTYRASIAGSLDLDTNTVPNMNLYFYQSQSFTNAP